MIPKVFCAVGAVISKKTIPCTIQVNPSTFRNIRSLSTNSGKKIRLSQRKRVDANKATDESVVTPFRVALLGGLTASAYAIYDIKQNKNGTLGQLYYGSPVEDVVNTVYSATIGKFEEIYEPSSYALLPDWPTAAIYGNPPPGTPAPPLLVLDLEKTLIGSVYDARHGWRHVKRPGLDKFLKALTTYFEVVIFSENDMGMSIEIMASIDSEGRCHKLGSNSAEIREDKVIKRLDYMNRDLGRIILIDDSEESSQMFPENTLLIKPFTNINDTTDSELLDLIPLLQAFYHDAIDFRRTIKDLGTNEASEACIEYKMRLSEKKNEEYKKRNKGLGGIIRGPQKKIDTMEPVRSLVPSATSLVGNAPEESALEKWGLEDYTNGSKQRKPSSKKKGGLMSWADDYGARKEEEANIRQEKMNEEYNKKMQEKYLEEQRQKAGEE